MYPESLQYLKNSDIRLPSTNSGPHMCVRGTNTVIILPTIHWFLSFSITGSKWSDFLQLWFFFGGGKNLARLYYVSCIKALWTKTKVENRRGIDWRRHAKANVVVTYFAYHTVGSGKFCLLICLLKIAVSKQILFSILFSEAWEFPLYLLSLVPHVQ